MYIQYKGFRVEKVLDCYWFGGLMFTSLEQMQEHINELDVEFYRGPTPYEIKFGEGATHYKSYKVKDLKLRKDGLLQVRLKDKVDGLIYTRR